MKVRTPQYYKKFHCIAGACTDTCCAGWDVDVDAASYRYYRQVPGDFGARLKAVMVPSDGGGCTFTLKEGRCPFLNRENLCDLYTALGEEHLCGTCAEFPRFINEYGGVREIGIAPSCKTAGELILNCREKLTFDETDDGRPVTSYNDIDAGLYMQLLRARETAYAVAQEEIYSTTEQCMLLLELGQRLQRLIDRGQEERIADTAAVFSDRAYCRRLLVRLRKKYDAPAWAYQAVPQYFKPFQGMEVIHGDWLKYCVVFHDFMETCAGEGGALAYQAKFRAFLKAEEPESYAYSQLLMYYLYRYFLDSVYDYNILRKMKNAVAGIVAMLQIGAAVWHGSGGVLTKAEQVDIAHLYSRQFEHSYTNYEQYQAFFEHRRCYSVAGMMRILNL